MNNNTLWEEKNLTEQMKNSVNKNKPEIYDITNDIKEKFVKNGWKDIGKIKRRDKSSHQIVIGKKYNYLTPTKLFCLDKKGRKLYKVKCDCGNEKIIYGHLMNLGIIKSCGCLHQKQIMSKFGISRRHGFGEAFKKSLYKTYQKGAKKRNLIFDIPFDLFLSLIEKPCKYCGALPYKKPSTRYFGTVAYNGLDRADNTKGYTIDNIVPCCHRCNQSKSNLTLNEFQKWIVNVYTTTILNNNSSNNL